jgi:hypothetical protein
MTRIRRVIAAFTLFALAGSVVAGCSRPSEYLMIVDDPALVSKINHLRDTGTSAPLKDLTDFEWDAVYTYGEGGDAKRINADLGRTVFEEGSSLAIYNALAVFTLGGEPARAITFLPIAFDGERHSANVVLQRGYTLVEPESASPTPGPSPT